MKTHHFILTVKTPLSKSAAKVAILSSFAKRQPDGCEFHLRDNAEHKDAWMLGANAGFDTAMELVEMTLSRLRKNLRKS